MGALGADTRVLGDRLGRMILQIADPGALQLPEGVPADAKLFRVCPSPGEAPCFEECP